MEREKGGISRKSNRQNQAKTPEKGGQKSDFFAARGCVGSFFGGINRVKNAVSANVYQGEMISGKRGSEKWKLSRANVYGVIIEFTGGD